jgi:hypothetical protein
MQRMKKIYLFILVFVMGATAFSQTTIFTYGTTWKYLDNGTDQGTAWRAAAFNDASWASGGGQLGYGDGDETTILNACGAVTQYPTCTNKYIGYYFRKTVNIPNVSLYQNFQFNMYRDDGVVIYVNGTEVYRNNMPTGTISYTTAASSAASDDGGSVISTTLSVAASQLVSGSNTIAVEVHQSGGTSSDVTWDLELVGLPLSSAGALITRGPYLQKGTSTSVLLRWQTDNATDSKVTYGTDSTNLSQSATVATSTTDHSVQLSGLLPYTKYYYSVGTTTGIIQSGGQNYFLTTPLAGTGDKYRFWVNGDCGNNSTNQKNVRDKYAQYVGNGTTNGILLAGDNAYNGGYDSEFQTNFFNIYQNGVMKHTYLYPAPGNHDYDNDATNQNTHAVPYYTIFDCFTNAEGGGLASNTEAFYSFDYDNIHFLSLDSYGKENSATRLYDTTGAQVTWIKQDLAANTRQWTVAYWHHPPYTMGSHTSDGEAELVNIRQNFIRILERMGVDLIICGHSHDYERSKLMKGHYGMENTFNATTHNLSQSSGKYNGTANSCAYLKDSLHTLEGTVYVVAGSAGQLGGTQTSFPHAAMYYSNATQGGSLVLEIEKNRLDAKWICYDGVVRDQFTIFKDASKVRTMTINYGDSVSVAASWVGQYNWTPSGGSAQSAMLHPTTSGTYVVSDPYQCVADTFHINVIGAPASLTSFTRGGNFNVYPNPAGNRFTISLSLEQETAVSIDIYDAMGKRIPVAVEKKMQSGTHELEIDREGLELANGIYFVKVKAGSEEKSIRLILK